MKNEAQATDRLSLQDMGRAMARLGLTSPPYRDGYRDGYRDMAQKCGLSDYLRGYRAGQNARLRGAHGAP